MNLKPIFEGRYSVSDLGDVFSNYYRNGQTDKIREEPLLMKQSSDNRGYKKVQIKRRGMLIHRLVATAFIPEFTESAMVNHKNGNPADNRLNNLEISNNSHNQKHSYTVTGNRSYRKLSEEKIEAMIKTFSNGVTLKELGEKFGVTLNAISSLLRIRLNDRKTPYGLKYKKDILLGFSKSRSSKFRHLAKKELGEQQ